MKLAPRLVIVVIAIAAVTYFVSATRYSGLELERGTQMFWSDKEAYIVSVRDRQGRFGSFLRYARQLVENYPNSGIPADDQLIWLEVTKVTATSTTRSVHQGTAMRPIGMLDGQIYARPKGQLSLWNEGHPTAVSAEDAARWSEMGKRSAFSSVDGWSYIASLLDSRGTETHDLTLDDNPITVRAVNSTDHKSIVLIRNGSPEIVLDISERAISLDADSYKRFVSTIPSR